MRAKKPCMLINPSFPFLPSQFFTLRSLPHHFLICLCSFLPSIPCLSDPLPLHSKLFFVLLAQSPPPSLSFFFSFLLFIRPLPLLFSPPFVFFYTNIFLFLLLSLFLGLFSSFLFAFFSCSCFLLSLFFLFRPPLSSSSSLSLSSSDSSLLFVARPPPCFVSAIAVSGALLHP